MFMRDARIYASVTFLGIPRYSRFRPQTCDTTSRATLPTCPSIYYVHNYHHLGIKESYLPLFKVADTTL